MTIYILNKPGPHQVGSHGETDETGRMQWRAADDAHTVDVDDSLVQALKAYDDAMEAYDTACQQDEDGLNYGDMDPSVYENRDDAAVEFASQARDGIAALVAGFLRVKA